MAHKSLLSLKTVLAVLPSNVPITPWQQPIVVDIMARATESLSANSCPGSSSSPSSSTSSSATQATGAAQGLDSNIGAVGAAMAALAFL